MAALRHAPRGGADDVVFTSLEGQVLEGPTSTVVWAAGGVLHTPPLDDRHPPRHDAWPGCSPAPRTTAGRRRSRPGTVDDLHAADAVWLLSGVRGAATVHTLDGVARGRRRALGAGAGAARR